MIGAVRTKVVVQLASDYAPLGIIVVAVVLALALALALAWWNMRLQRRMKSQGER